MARTFSMTSSGSQTVQFSIQTCKMGGSVCIACRSCNVDISLPNAQLHFPQRPGTRRNRTLPFLAGVGKRTGTKNVHTISNASMDTGMKKYFETNSAIGDSRGEMRQVRQMQVVLHWTDLKLP